jgi:hypothetical protein
VILEGHGEHWSACSLSYGSKELQADALLAYESLVVQYLTILDIENGEKRDAAELDWLVRAAANPLTRWEGAYELDPAPLHTVPSEAAKNRCARLSSEQRALLLEALLASPRRDEGTDELFGMFRSDPDPRLTYWVLTMLEKDASHLPWDYDDLLLFAMPRICDPHLDAWVHATWTSHSFDSSSGLTFRSDTKGFKKRKKEEIAAVIEFVERARAALDQR